MSDSSGAVPPNHNFLGWHGTSDLDLSKMKSEGVRVQESGNFDGYSQWGPGFYVAVARRDAIPYANRRIETLKTRGTTGCKPVVVPVFLPDDAPIRILSIAGGEDPHGAIDRTRMDFKKARHVNTQEWENIVVKGAQVRDKDRSVTDFSGFDSGRDIRDGRDGSFIRRDHLYTAIGGTVKDPGGPDQVYQIMLREMVLGYIVFGTAEPV
jgi:hypothetical protein